MTTDDPVENALLVDDVLDNPVWAALTGPHASFAEADRRARRRARTRTS
ncbi:hypothetical protein [Parafrankia discariae]|nr:hypothetical protein [Parafrankia discariae]